MVLNLVLVGCATIVGDETQLMSIRSIPTGASVRITDASGSEVSNGTTPMMVPLNGRFCAPFSFYQGQQSYQIKLTKAGYAPLVIPLTANHHGLHIACTSMPRGLVFGQFFYDPWHSPKTSLLRNPDTLLQGIVALLEQDTLPRLQ